MQIISKSKPNKWRIYKGKSVKIRCDKWLLTPTSPHVNLFHLGNLCMREYCLIWLTKEQNDEKKIC